MGSSLYLSGGVQETAKLTRRFSVSNSFAVGDVVRWDTGSASYVKAQADTATNAEVAGIVSDANSAAFSIVYSGEIDLKGVASLSGFSGPVLFLSNTTAGGLTSNPPSAIGSVVKPLVVRNANTNEYIVTNFLGTQIGGSSTVAIDEIQPVGTIMPFAGSAIPDSWLACDGNSYAIASYPQLYAKLQNSSGDRAPAYGYVVEIGVNTTAYSAFWAAVLVGDTIVYSPTQTNLTTSTVTQYSLIGKVLAKGASSITVQVYPTYSANKTFVFPNAIPSAGYIAAFAPTTYFYDSLVVGNRRADAAATQAGQSPAPAVSTVSVTHFNTPDLRGRFALGVNTSNLGELEGDSFISAISGIYSLGSEGGQENILVDNTQLGTGTSGKYTVTSTSSTGTIANMPPYTVVRYIIKATPYTRAALIDGLDVPYNQLLVGDLRDGSLRPGGNGEDLVFKTNNGVGGTERMRLTNSGALGVGRTTLLSTPSSTVNQMLAVQNNSNAGTWMSVYNTNTTGSSAYAALHLNNNVTNGYVAVYGNNAGSHANMTSLENDITGGGLLLYSGSANGPVLFKVGGGVERMRVSGDGRVAIGTSNTTNAKLKISESSTATTINTGTATMVVVNPDTTVSNWSRIQLTDNDAAAGGVLIGAQCTDHSNRYYNFAVNTKGSDGQVTRLFIDTTGRMGINKSTSLVSTLDVGGDVTATSFAGKGAIPIGGIIMWSGTSANIPSGWALCDGNNGTPNLTGRFIMGGSTNSSGSTWTENITGNTTTSGGSKDSIVVSHSHFIASNTSTTSLGTLSSTNYLQYWGGVGSGSSLMYELSGSSTVPNIGNTNTFGSSGTNANLPPYYVLAFIMRVS